MAKFLTTTANSYFIEEIIIRSQNTLTLVTPFLKLSTNLFERISDANKKGVKITVIYGKNDLQRSEKEKLFSLDNVRVFFCKNLHAKCYHNESSMIITSMNLYEFSEKNNREMGIFIEKERDEDIFSESMKEIESIKNASTLKKDFSIKNIEAKTETSQFHIDPNYSKLHNFHIPVLNKELKKKYPDREVQLREGAILIPDFPSYGVSLKVSGRIDFLFDQSLDYRAIKSRNTNYINKDLSDRFYWNRYQLNIYTAKSFSVELNEEGLQKTVERFMRIISEVEENLRIDNGGLFK